MSDASQGPDWWLGADGKWYPPVAASSPNPAGPTGPIAPGQGVPAPVVPGPFPAGQAPPGYAPPVVVQEKSKATPILLGCLLAVLVVPVIAVICIAAVTLLGKSSTSKFSSVGTAISVVEAPAPGATAPPR